MEEYRTIVEIVQESVKTSSYATVAISSGVFVIYTLIIKLIEYFKSKNRNKPLIEMATALKENTENILKLNNILDKTFKEAERKETIKCQQVIGLAFNSFKSKVSQECEQIIVHNNIDENKQYIVENITKLVNTEYYKIYQILSAYEINEVNVASKLKEEWIRETIDSVLNIIYNTQPPLNRILQINNRLSLNTNNYATYINNKVF